MTGVKEVEGQEIQLGYLHGSPAEARTKKERTQMRKLTRTLAAAATATLPIAGAAWAQAGERYYYGPHDMMGGWFGGVLMMLLMIALIVGAVVLTLRLLGHGPAGRPSGRALDVLNERFARGEIDRAEYEDRRRALQDGESR